MTYECIVCERLKVACVSRVAHRRSPEHQANVKTWPERLAARKEAQSVEPAPVT